MCVCLFCVCVVFLFFCERIFDKLVYFFLIQLKSVGNKKIFRQDLFLGTFSLLALKMSAIPPNCSLYEILQSPCGSSREEVEHVLLSECNADISTHLASCHLSKCREVTEAKLIMARAGIQHFSRIQLEGMTICPRHRHLLGRFRRGPRSCQYPGHTGKVTSVAGSHVITFLIADEIRLIF